MLKTIVFKSNINTKVKKTNWTYINTKQFKFSENLIETRMNQFMNVKCKNIKISRREKLCCCICC